MPDWSIGWSTPLAATDPCPGESGNGLRAAAWLLLRSPRLSRLVERVPGVVRDQGDGSGPWPDLDLLTYALAWHDRADDRDGQPNPPRPPRAELNPRSWLLGCQAAREALDVMSPSERTCLRMLTLFATYDTPRCGPIASDLHSLDRQGVELFADLQTALACHRAHSYLDHS